MMESFSMEKSQAPQRDVSEIWEKKRPSLA